MKCSTLEGERPVRLLLVEDDPNDQLLFAAAVRKAGLNLQLECVNHGQEAVAYLEGRGPVPDLLVLDLRMPVMDGFEVLAWRRSSARFCKLPAMVLSGSLGEQWREQALALGAEKLFLKPCRLEDWAHLVRELAERARRSAVAASRAVEPVLAAAEG